MPGRSLFLSFSQALRISFAWKSQATPRSCHWLSLLPSFLLLSLQDPARPFFQGKADRWVRTEENRPDRPVGGVERRKISPAKESERSVLRYSWTKSALCTWFLLLLHRSVRRQWLYFFSAKTWWFLKKGSLSSHGFFAKLNVSLFFFWLFCFFNFQLSSGEPVWLEIASSFLSRAGGKRNKLFSRL